ncbi:glycine-rich domain-containing protein [Cecembia calidifontis]|uniref:Glycine-rich domain-containing protein n=1 Tax=Cecembia calidifontis TaxID=1187080 RepID=A0A4Q7P6Z4_9BACT|nr:hypothetical protein [Cecembia calidifontis]RZS95775.1 hypothetical protein BC751_1317 [Cecembia calidifontis]
MNYLSNLDLIERYLSFLFYLRKPVKYSFFSLLLCICIGNNVALGQACDSGCDFIFDTATGGPNIPNNTIPKVICITAANRTGNISLNTQNATVCISENTVFTGTITNTGSNNTINNFGQYGAIGSARSIALGVGVTYNNFGTHIGNVTLNGANSTYNNSGDQTGSVTLNSSTSDYTNSGTQTGNLNLNGGSVINSGQIILNTGNFNSGTSFNNLSTGSVSVSTNVNINNSFDNQGSFQVTGTLILNSSGSLSNSGSVEITGNLTSNSSTLNSQSGTINIGGTLTNNSGTLNIGSGTVAGNTTNNNGNINIFGQLNIGGNLDNNGSGNVSAGNNNQINYLNVGGGISGSGCLNGTEGTLIVNQPPPGCTNGTVAVGGSPSDCLQILTIENGDGTVDRIFRFTCSTGWTIPNNTEEEEIVDEAQVLIVAGGGGGGRGTSAGGGGAGGLIFQNSVSLNPGSTIPVIVGIGGAGSTSTNARGQNGTNSSFLSFTAIGGGGGGSVVNNANRNGAGGGSGGGGARQGSNNGTAGTGEFGQGRNGAGGGAAGSGIRGGGGGGAGGPGEGSNGAGGRDGGPGESYDISGESITYSAGGGASSTGPGNNGDGFGGSSVGGNANGSGALRNGRSPGSGGGATSSGVGGNGANGIVIVRQTFRILPVEYLYFEAAFRRQERVVELRWATGKEWENSHFEIERAVGNVRNWEKIGRIEGRGYSDDPVEYLFKDQKPPLVGGNIFYRLKQVDFNGKFAYSKVISVRVPAMEVINGVWRAFPNPTDGENFRVSLVDRSQYEEEAITLRLVHPMIFTPPQTIASETEMNARIEELVRKMPKGVFVVEIQWGRKVEHIKVLKQ